MNVINFMFSWRNRFAGPGSDPAFSPRESRPFRIAAVIRSSLYGASSRAILSGLVFTIFFFLTLISWMRVRDLQAHNADAQFDRLVSEAASQIKIRLSGYEQLLKGMQGYMIASGPVSRDGWRSYLEGLGLADRYAGIHGVGFAKNIPPSELADHIASIRSSGYPEYKVWPEDAREKYTAIIYLEPFSGRNLRAFGYDMYSEAVGGAAMARSRDSGQTVISGKVRLVMETSEDIQAGVLMYTPYFGGALPSTIDQRRSSLIGYIYAPFGMDDFIRTILQFELQSIDLKIFDGELINESSLLFDSTGHGDGAKFLPKFTRTIVLPIYGQKWTIEATSRTLFEKSTSRHEASLVLLGGILLSLLSSAVFFALLANKEKARVLSRMNGELLYAIEEQRVASRELSVSKLRTEKILESITDAFYTVDRNWRFTYLNSEAENLLQRPRARLLGSNIWEQFPEAVGTSFDREYRRALAQHCTVDFEEFYSPLKGWFEVHAYPSEEGLAVYFRDITARKQAEAARRKADAQIRQQAALLDHATDAIIVRGLDNRIQFWNKGAERLYGWASEEVIGQAVENVIYDDPALFYELMRQVLEAGEVRGEVPQRRKDGSRLTAEAHWTLVQDDEGQSCSILAINTDITQRKKAETEIQHLAFYDSLTQLPNRQLLLDRLKRSVATTTRTRQTGALLFIDLDNFKLLNDTLGHHMGDQLLRQVAERLANCVREVDTVARLGGDEFVIILAPVSGEEADQMVFRTKVVCDRIRSAFSRPFNLGACQQHSTPSIGVTLFDGNQATVDELLKQADVAMYQAKASGRNGLCFFSPEMQEILNVRAMLESDLYKGVENGELTLHYQPQTDGACVIGAEALLRWQHPRRGLLSPCEFIDVAEDTGLILRLGEWALRTACVQLAAWSTQPVMAHLHLAVNISSRQFRQSDFVEQVMAAIETAGADPAKLKLELTESLLIDNVEDTIVKMSALKARGIGFALDDFGTGYSSLNYLKRLPLDWLKIDQSFVKNVLDNSHDASIVCTIVALAHSMGLGVVAEGVETLAQQRFLARNGCDAYQGYLFSKPLSIDEFPAYVLRSMGAESMPLRAISARPKKRQAADRR